MHGETITLLLLIILGFTTWQGLNQPGVMEKYLFSTDAIRFHRQWIRLVSPAFLHSSWGHFGGNAITLYFFGRFLENREGPGILLGIFFLSVAGGHLLCLWLHKEGGDYRAIGASGGALGVLFATILLSPGMRMILFPLPIPIPGWLYALGFLFYTLSSLRGGSGVSHEAHLGGMLSGVAVTLLYYPWVFRTSPFLVTVILLTSAGGLWYFHQNPGRVPGFFRFQVKSAVAQHQQRKRREESGQVDALLDKVSQHGLHSLSKRERKLLEEASKRRGGKR
jgi:membrane associated rhomboid family serine protease